MERMRRLLGRFALASVMAVIGAGLGSSLAPVSVAACEDDTCENGYLWSSCSDAGYQGTGCDYYGSGWPYTFCRTYNCY